MLSFISLLYLSIVFFTFASSRPVRKDGLTVFKTEPSFILQYFDIETLTNKPSLLSDGYIFFDPSGGGQAIGPQIYKQDGTLVWYNTLPEGRRVQDFHVCDYLGEKGNHLCWNEMLGTDDINNRNPSNKFVMDSNYKVIKRYDKAIGKAVPNLHEFNMVDDGASYVQPVYPLLEMDLRPYSGTRQGYAWDACFQEVDAKTSTSLFEWCWLDYFEIWETSIFFENDRKPNPVNATASKAGKGTYFSPFDAAHINSIDKNDEGDYLVSVRHSNQILKIAGLNHIHGAKPGTVLWILGGKSNQFTYEEDWTPFGKQHCARFVPSSSQNETLISVFDNAWEGNIDPSNDFSSALLISLNEEAKSASLLHRYPHPHNEISESQGSASVLRNGNMFIGWGFLPEISEFSASGDLLYHAKWSNRQKGNKHEHSYRTFKSPWKGLPTSKPKIVAYSHYSNIGPRSPLIAAVSWNGATEVAYWRFKIATSPDGPWFDVGTWPTSGFETEVELLHYPLLGVPQAEGGMEPYYVAVGGIDGRGKVLGSEWTQTFVPVKKMAAKHCSKRACRRPPNRAVATDSGQFSGSKKLQLDAFDYDILDSCGARCPAVFSPWVFAPQFIVLAFLVLVFEFGNLMWQGLFNSRSYGLGGPGTWGIVEACEKRRRMEEEEARGGRGVEYEDKGVDGSSKANWLGKNHQASWLRWLYKEEGGQEGDREASDSSEKEILNGGDQEPHNFPPRGRTRRRETSPFQAGRGRRDSGAEILLKVELWD